MKKQLCGIIISASLLMGCQSTSTDTNSAITSTPTIESFVHYYDQQIKGFITDDIGSVATTDEEIIVLLNGDKSFDSGSIDIKSEGRMVLSHLAALLNNKPESEVFIAGHTDSRGSKTFNMSLSNKRAHSVFAFLTDNGVDGNRLTTYGFGESEPIATNMNAEGRKKNRRIEIRITPMPGHFEQ